MTDTHDWLDRREADVPVSMRTPMRLALATTGNSAINGRDLLDASVVCLRDALERGDSRSAAVHLLAVDALLTSAFAEAVTEDSAAVLDLADQAAVALAALLPDPSA
jgi:hypothetical protein